MPYLSFITILIIGKLKIHLRSNTVKPFNLKFHYVKSPLGIHYWRNIFETEGHLRMIIGIVTAR